MRVPTILLFAVFATSCFIGFNSQTNAQEIRKAMRDYRHDSVFNYQPDDPEFRSKMFKIHTGHYGKFYNCDGQEDKRYSPYICWKTHHENNFPTKMGIRERIGYDIAEVKQRLIDGAGACQVGCRCNDCIAVDPVQNSCNCAECNLPASNNSTTKGSMASSRHQSYNAHTKLPPIVSKQAARINSNSAHAELKPALPYTPKFGLVSGKTLNNRLANGSLQTQNQTSAKTSRVADKRTSSFWNALKR